VAALRAAVDIIQRPVAVDTTLVAEVVDTPAVAVAIRVVAATPAAEVVDTPVAAIPVAEAIAKKLGDSMSPREAAT
jgi:hypothetical protein